jgi:isochorismate hydrolase
VKEIYFTPQDLTVQASRMRDQAQSHRGGQPLNPARSALLVLDLQNYFLDPSSHAFVPSAPAILPGIQALIRAYRRRSLPVVFTRHANTPQDAAMMACWWRDLLALESPLSKLSPLLETGDCPVLLKSQYDAFYQTGLEETLRQVGVRQVLVCGVMAHLCCETTARSAFTRGFEVFFLVDGTASYNRDFHQASLLNLAHGFASLLLTGEALAALETG